MIGVFDSGVGGLTVLKALLAHFPQERFLYLGDSAFAPYGNRGADEIYSLTRRGVETLFRGGCGLVIIACNTACAVALRPLQQQWLPYTEWSAQDKQQRRLYNLVGVFVPLIEEITGKDWRIAPTIPKDPPREVKRIGFFATLATVMSNRFVGEMERFAPHIKVFQQACPHLAEVIEAEAAPKDIEAGVKRYVKNMAIQTKAAGIDLTILGCTHYEIVREYFAKYLPPHAQLINQPQAVAKSLQSYLTRHPQFTAKARGEAAGLTCLTSGDPEKVSRTAKLFWGEDGLALPEFIHIGDYFA